MKLRQLRFIRRRRLAHALKLCAMRRRWFIYIQTLALAAFYTKGQVKK